MPENWMLEGGSAPQDDLPRYRQIESLPAMFVKIVPLSLLAAYMLVTFSFAYQALHTVLTCAPVKASAGYTDGYDLSGTQYDYANTGSSKNCVPAELHASWLPASLGAFSITALAVLALVFAAYLLNLAHHYIEIEILQVPGVRRGFHTVPDQVKHAVKGLTLASGIFMFATVVMYCIIYLVALS